MGGSDIFSIVGSALSAQDARLGAIASNLANAGTVAPPGSQPYRAHEIVFAAAPLADGGTEDSGTAGDTGDTGDVGVRVAGAVESNAPPVQSYDPGSKFADAQGYVTGSNVSQVGQMVDLIDSTNSYAAAVAVLQQSTRIDQQMLASFQVA